MEYTPDVRPGQDVMYVLPDGPHAGEARPAKVIKAWSPTCVQLAVFIDGTNDAPGMAYGSAPLAWRTSVTFNLDKQPGTWHWA